jgi:hypothetical protein
MARLADQLAALATMSPAQLRSEWRRVCQTPPPARLTTDLLRRGIAYRLQERVHGGLPGSHARELDRMVKRRLADVARARGAGADRAEPRLRPGTRLVRAWQGRTYHVLVAEHGFVMDDREYPSLSRIAEAITGAHWSGPRFFGIDRKAAKRRPGPAVSASRSAVAPAGKQTSA